MLMLMGVLFAAILAFVLGVPVFPILMIGALVQTHIVYRVTRSPALLPTAAGVVASCGVVLAIVHFYPGVSPTEKFWFGSIFPSVLAVLLLVGSLLTELSFTGRLLRIMEKRAGSLGKLR